MNKKILLPNNFDHFEVDVSKEALNEASPFFPGELSFSQFNENLKSNFEQVVL